VHILEDARRVLRRLVALLRVKIAVEVDDHCFARRDVAHQLEVQRVQRDAFRGQHVLRPPFRLALAEHQRADAPGITETDDAVAVDEGDDGIASDAAVMHVAHRLEHDLGRDAMVGMLLQAVREHVEDDLGIGFGVEMPPVGMEQRLLQLAGVDEIAVVDDGNAERRVGVERLRLVRAGGAGGGIAHVANADVALQLFHAFLVEHVRDQAIVLVDVNPAIRPRENSGGVLSAMLQDRQGVIDRLVDGRVTDDADNSTHESLLPDQEMDSGRRSSAHSASGSKYSMTTDSCHQGSRGSLRSSPTVTSATTSTSPRNNPNTVPSARSGPVSPVLSSASAAK